MILPGGSNRGVHIVPFSFHGFWCGDADRRRYWLDLLVAMHISWVVLLTDGDSCLEVFDGKEVIRWFLELGITPIIRDVRKLPRSFVNYETVARTAAIHKEYGLVPFWQPYNEPMDSREWIDETVPPDWWSTFLACWKQAANLIIDNGGYVGFPDGPGYDFDEAHPFRDTMDVRWIWDRGYGFYSGHYYSKNRPRAYPYDDVNRFGLQLTAEQWEAELGRWWGDPNWMDPPLEDMNAQRIAWADEGATILTDDTCWRAWEKIDHYAEQTLGYKVPQAMTEGGRVPRDRPGSYPNIDIRYTLSTPEMVAIDTLGQYEDNEAPMFAQCPWLLAGADMGGDSTWEDNAWVSYCWQEIYGSREKPVVQLLKSVAPGGNVPMLPELLEEVDGHLGQAGDRLVQALGTLP